MENAQALAATAKSGSEPKSARVLLQKVYTPSPVAIGSHKTVGPKTLHGRHLTLPIPGPNPMLRCILATRGHAIYGVYHYQCGRQERKFSRCPAEGAQPGPFA
jgi:hypothetical protein